MTRAMNADPKTALASRFATKARADNKFSRKRPRRLGGSPAALAKTTHAELRQLRQKRLLLPPYSPGRVANTAGDYKRVRPLMKEEYDSVKSLKFQQKKRKEKKRKEKKRKKVSTSG